MTEYNATITYRARNVERDDAADELLDALIAYHPALGVDKLGHLEAIITFPADSLRQAITTALAVAERATTWPVLGVQVIPTDIFDARAGLAPLPETVGVPEAAQILGVSEQAIRQRLASGSLIGHREGRDWRIQRTALHPPKRTPARPAG